MRKYGWEWMTEAGLKSWQELIFSIIAAGGTIGDDLWKFVGLADQIIHHEKRFPDSFIILTQLGDIYSMAALFTAKDVSLSNDLIGKAHAASDLASKYFNGDKLQDPESVNEETDRVYLLHYYMNLCRIGITKYLQTDCKEVAHLHEVKPYYDKALILSPENDLLIYIGNSIAQNRDSSTARPNGYADYYDEFLRQGSLYLFRKHYRGASAAFRQAIAMRPQEALPRIRLSWAEISMEGSETADIRRILKDLEYVDSLLQNAPNRSDTENKVVAELQYVRGACHYLLGEKDKAAVHLKESLKINPEMDLSAKLLRKIHQDQNGDKTTPGGRKAGGCFIATAVYGTSIAPEVITLQKFRDDILLKSDLGRLAVNAYYEASPYIAGYLEGRSALKRIIRIVFMDSLVRCARGIEKWLGRC